ncbi:MAG: rhomboid family intramembrane serine protease [Sulfurovum sp.]
MREDILKYRVTYSIIIINIIVYIFSALFSMDLMDMDSRVLFDMGALYAPVVITQNEWWRLFTAMFLHGGMMHIVMNMFSLYIIGKGVEIYFTKVSYLVIYISSGFVGGLVSLYMHDNSIGIGASGAIFGVFGALAGFFIANRAYINDNSKAFIKNFSAIIGLNLIIGLAIPSIDMSAHIGGLIVGFIAGYILSKNPKLVIIYSVIISIIMVGMGSYLSSQYISAIF